MANQSWAPWIELAKSAPILEAAQKLGATLKKSGSNEWAGPCPTCGGVDRFSVNTAKRVFNCRGSEGAGDVIAMVMHIEGVHFVPACELITGEKRPDNSRDETEAERIERERRNEYRINELRGRQEAQDKEAAERSRKEEEHVAKVVDRAVPIDGTHAESYIRARGLNPQRRFTGDLRFVRDLDYWGQPDNAGSSKPIKLGEFPALVAIIRAFDGGIIGISQTYLDPVDPKKLKPPGSPRNANKKIRGEKKHGMIRLGRVGATMAIAEGWENALAWHQLGNGPDDVCLAAAVDLGNLSGGATGTAPHPMKKDGDGRPLRIPNGFHDKSAPGMILPDGVKSIILIGDGDSEYVTTRAKVAVAVRRFLDFQINVDVTWPPAGLDFNTLLQREHIQEPMHG